MKCAKKSASSLHEARFFRSLTLCTAIVLSSCLLATAIGPAQLAKKVLRRLYVISGPSSTKAQNSAETNKAVVVPEVDFSGDIVQEDTTSNLVAVAGALPRCQNLPPICAGGLLKQSASVDKINAYIAKYLSSCMGTSPPTCTCRWIQPPRCYTGQKRTCAQECTP